MKKILKNFFIAVGIILLAFIVYYWQKDYSSERQIIFGVTFGKPHAQYLGLDWKKAYQAILDDLGVRHLRLAAYWNEIEKQPGKYDFRDLDWQIKEAEKRGAKVILMIGRRLPRWPECHTPAWAEKLSERDQQRWILTMLQEAVMHYKKSAAIAMWQIDNEPFVAWFGKCPAPDPELLKKEIDLVRSIDKRPILVTDSGELSTWRKAINAGDFFGTTVYRVVYNKYYGYFHYHLPAAFYRLRAAFWGRNPETIIISELQAEPWATAGIFDASIAEQKQAFDATIFQRSVKIAQQTGFKEAYFWGAEYWYWLKEKGDPSLWTIAKQIWNQ